MSNLVLNGVCCSSSHLKEGVVTQAEDLKSAYKGPVTQSSYQTKENENKRVV